MTRYLPLLFLLTFAVAASAQDEVEIAIVEIASPSGIDPCGPSAISTEGCDETGNNVRDSFNSDGTYIVSVVGPAGSESMLPNFAPNDYEIRFTAEGSYAYWPFTTGNMIWVPFEVWDIGDETPLSENDPSDDIQMVPAMLSDSGGECDFNFGESEVLGRLATDRIYAYYPVDDDYAAYEAEAAAVVAADPNGCPTDPATATAAGLIDFSRGRPLQREVFVDNTGTGDIDVLQNAIVRFYTIPAIPDVDIAITSFANAPMRGGSVFFRGPVTNNEASPVPVYVYAEVQLPDGGTYKRNIGGKELAPGETFKYKDFPGSKNSIPVPDFAAAGEYTLTVFAASDRNGTTIYDSASFSFTLPPNDGVLSASVPTEGGLVIVTSEAGPNPFREATVIRYSLAEAAEVDLRVYDALGREVATLVSGSQSAGPHEATLGAGDLTDGVYLWRLSIGGEVTTGQVTLTR